MQGGRQERRRKELEKPDGPHMLTVELKETVAGRVKRGTINKPLSDGNRVHEHCATQESYHIDPVVPHFGVSVRS